MVMAHPLGSDTSSQVQGYAAVKKVGVPDFTPQCQWNTAGDYWYFSPHCI